ncbi:ABC transporter substrate-binding protein [Candidatus Pacearchaeota archaeon]|nr:ABC transporter substrate-binding protein [Candidatus Pacearchaeota archaeon]
MKNKELVFGLSAMVVVFIVLFVYSNINQTDSIEKEGVIKIGWIGPLTGYGAVWGEISKNTAELVVNDINSNGGIDGRELEIIYEDGKCNGKEAVSAVQKLIDVDSVKIIFVSCSQEVFPVAPITEKNKVILFGTYSTNKDISNLGDYVFRNAYSDSDIAEIAFETISKDHKSIGIISELNDYAIGIRDDLNNRFEEVGIEVNRENFVTGSTEFKSQVINILDKDPDAVLVNPSSLLAGITILKELTEFGFEGQVYGNFFGSSNEVQNSLYSDGMIYFADPTVSESIIKKELFERYKDRYGEYPDLEFPIATQHDSLYILKQAIEECRGADTDCIRDYLYDLESFTGALGTYSFDENGDLEGIKPSVNIIRDGDGILYEE